jgi:hypothetical protein
MCFNTNTVDDPTQPPMRKSSNPFTRKVHDPTQQPVHITQSEDSTKTESAPESQAAAPDRKKSLGSHSYKNRAAFVDVTDDEHHTMTRKTSNPQAETPKKEEPKSVPKNWRGRSSNPGTFGMGYGTDFGAMATM